MPVKALSNERVVGGAVATSRSAMHGHLRVVGDEGEQMARSLSSQRERLRRRGCVCFKVTFAVVPEVVLAKLFALPVLVALENAYGEVACRSRGLW